MRSDVPAVENFANLHLSEAGPGFHYESEVPAMSTPVVVACATAVEFIVTGSTICLNC